MEETRCAPEADDLKPWTRSPLSCTFPLYLGFFRDSSYSGYPWDTDYEFLLETLSDFVFCHPKCDRIPGSSPRPPATAPQVWPGGSGQGRVGEKTANRHTYSRRATWCCLCPLALPGAGVGLWGGWGGAAHFLSWPAGGAVGSRSAATGAGKGASTSRRSQTLPLGPRLGRKTRPHPTGSQRRGNLGGRKRGDVVRNRGVFQRPESCVGGRAPGRLLRCGLWAALGLLSPRPGHRGTNLGPVLPAPLEGPQGHSSTPAGAAARISAGPVADTVFLAAARSVGTSAGEATLSAEPQPPLGAAPELGWAARLHYLWSPHSLISPSLRPPAPQTC